MPIQDTEVDRQVPNYIQRWYNEGYRIHFTGKSQDLEFLVN